MSSRLPLGSKSAALATTVLLGMTAVAGTAFSESPAPERSVVSTDALRSKQASAILAAYEGAKQAKERADQTRYFSAVAQQAAAQAAADAQARAARDREVQLAQQRAARAAARPQGVATGNWADLINQYPWPRDVAYRVMMCESGGNANAYNPRSGATGLFQILNGPFDPAQNVARAFAMWQGRGWQPWRSSASCWS